MCGGAAT
jgi:hypothetical protein